MTFPAFWFKHQDTIETMCSMYYLMQVVKPMYIIMFGPLLTNTGISYVCGLMF